jgi:hypothetical protein
VAPAHQRGERRFRKKATLGPTHCDRSRVSHAGDARAATNDSSPNHQPRSLAAATVGGPQMRTRTPKMYALAAPSRTRHGAAARTRYREHLPEVQCLSAKSGVQIVSVLACLTNTFHSQGFSPSQRCGPYTPLWLYFKPLPLIGFVAFRAFPTRASRCASRHPLLSCHWNGPLSRVRQAWQDDLATVDPGTRSLASEPCSDLVSDTLRHGIPSHKAAALLAFLLSEVYQPDRRPRRVSPHALTSHLASVVAHIHLV